MAIERMGSIFTRSMVLTGVPEEQTVSLWQSGQDGNLSDRDCYRRFLLHALRFLSAIQQEAITRYYLEGERIPAIAEALGVSRSTVCRRLRAGQEMLRRLAQLCIDAGFLPP